MKNEDTGQVPAQLKINANQTKFSEFFHSSTGMLCVNDSSFTESKSL